MPEFARLGLRALPIVGMPWQELLFAPVWCFLRPFDRFLRPFCARVWHIFCVNSIKKCYSASFARDKPFQRKEVQITKKCTMSICTQNFGYERRSGGVPLFRETPYRCVFVTISIWWYYHLDTQYPLILDWLPTHFVNSFHVDLMVDINPSDL